jgi:hypothetical protein
MVIYPAGLSIARRHVPFLGTATHLRTASSARAGDPPLKSQSEQFATNRIYVVGRHLLALAGRNFQIARAWIWWCPDVVARKHAGCRNWMKIPPAGYPSGILYYAPLRTSGRSLIRLHQCQRAPAREESRLLAWVSHAIVRRGCRLG